MFVFGVAIIGLFVVGVVVVVVGVIIIGDVVVVVFSEVFDIFVFIYGQFVFR